MSFREAGGSGPETMVCAHRGASADLPDNSLAAFEAAIGSGCEAIETDIRRAPDGRLVLAHDAEEALAPGVVELSALVAMARGRIGLDLELKEPGLEGDLLAAVEGGEDWLLVTSFLPAVVARVGLLAPAVATGLLVEDDEDDPVAEALACGAGALAIEEALLTAPLAKRAARRRVVAVGLDGQRSQAPRRTAGGADRRRGDHRLPGRGAGPAGGDERARGVQRKQHLGFDDDGERGGKSGWKRRENGADGVPGGAHEHRRAGRPGAPGRAAAGRADARPAGPRERPREPTSASPATRSARRCGSSSAAA